MNERFADNYSEISMTLLKQQQNKCLQQYLRCTIQTILPEKCLKTDKAVISVFSLLVIEVDYTLIPIKAAVTP